MIGITMAVIAGLVLGGLTIKSATVGLGSTPVDRQEAPSKACSSSET